MVVGVDPDAVEEEGPDCLTVVEGVGSEIVVDLVEAGDFTVVVHAGVPEDDLTENPTVKHPK